MKVVPLRLPVQKLIDELRQLPRDHTPVGDKEPMCPLEEALDLLKPVPAKTIFS